MDIEIHEAQMFPNRINPKKTSLRYVIIKLSKVKDKENFAGRRRKAICQLQEHSLPPRQDDHQISQQKLCRPGESEMIYSKSLKKLCQPRIQYLKKIFFKTEDKIIFFLDKQTKGVLSSQDLFKKYFREFFKLKQKFTKYQHKSIYESINKNFVNGYII